MGESTEIGSLEQAEQFPVTVDPGRKPVVIVDNLHVTYKVLSSARRPGPATSEDC